MFEGTFRFRVTLYNADTDTFGPGEECDSLEACIDRLIDISTESLVKGDPGLIWQIERKIARSAPWVHVVDNLGTLKR